jgi:ATP-binding cassette, subfamily B, multidrug efflux pump
LVKKWIIGEFLKKNRYKYLAGISAIVASSMLQIVIPKLIGYITDTLKDQTRSLTDIYWLSAAMLGTSVLLFCMKFMLRYFIMGRSRDLECFLRAKLFSHFQSLPPKFYNNRKTGDLMAYAINDLGSIRQAFAFGIVFLIDGIIINLASIIVMGKTINPVLTVITVVPVMSLIILILKLRKKIRTKFTVVQEAFAHISDKIQENISGIRVVKAFGQEDEEIEKLEKASINRMKAQMDYVKISAALAPAVQICFGISFTLALVVGGRMVRSGVITLGDFIAFNTYLALLAGPINHVGKIVEVWQRAIASIKRLDDIFEVSSDIMDDNNSIVTEKINGQITINNLHFTYPGSSRESLRGIDINVPAGKTLAIIGKTGSGKTTLVNLLLRLFKVERGKIFIDDVDINDIPLGVLRENIGYVPQDNFLFSATISDNIEFFNKIYNESDVEEAARISSVFDSITGFPEGFLTMVGERGITLSGGQKQRISIARAVIKDPAILVLDDSMSAVDTKTEEEILKNIKEVLKGRTGIIIAHRISTVKHADEIIVMDEGRIVERGSHSELLRKKGEYFKLYSAQMVENKLKGTQEVLAI